VLLLHETGGGSKKLVDESLDEHELIQGQEVEAGLLQHLVLIIAQRAQSEGLHWHFEHRVYFALRRGRLRVLLLPPFLSEIDEVALLATLNDVRIEPAHLELALLDEVVLLSCQLHLPLVRLLLFV
jgi:hypothetical protein